MLKRLAVLTICIPLAAVGILAAQDAQIGTPKQGIAKGNSGQNGSEHPQSQGSKQPTPIMMAAASQPTAPSCDEACQQGRQNLKIQGELAVFTGLLVAVGTLEVGVGLAQVILLAFTWKTIRRQVAVQESEFLQWVDIGEWDIKSDAIVDLDNLREIDARIRFSVLNDTARPLSIHAVRTDLQIGPTKDWRNYLVNEKRDIPPKGRYIVIIDTKLAEQQTIAFIKNWLFISATISVEYANALGKLDCAEFQAIITGGKERTQALGKGYVSKETKNTNGPNPN